MYACDSKHTSRNLIFAKRDMLLWIQTWHDLDHSQMYFLIQNFDSLTRRLLLGLLSNSFIYAHVKWIKNSTLRRAIKWGDLIMIKTKFY